MAPQVADLGKLPRIVSPLPGPKAQAIIRDDQRFISPSYTRSYPLVAERASGAIVEDPDGNLFLDFSAGIAVVSTGHCHPDVVRAIQNQSANLIHMSGTDFYYRQMPELAQKLSALLQSTDDRGIGAAFSETPAPKRLKHRSSWRDMPRAVNS
jgi:4-aminobutyrate aminotransferase-like enzyme